MNPISRIAPVADAEAGAEDAGGHANWHAPRSTRRRLIVISASAVMTLALGAGIIAAVNSGRPSAAGTGHYTVLGPGGLSLAQPLPGAHRSTVSGASRVAGFAIPLPHQAAANRTNLTRVWVDNNQTVALVFAHAKVAIGMWPAVAAMKADPEAWFRSFARKNANASFHWVNGAPAEASRPGAESYPPNMAVVALDRNGIYIEIDSTSYGTQTLLAIARSLH